MNPKAYSVNRKNLRVLAWQRGHHGVSGLARSLGRHRTTLHRAVRNPQHFAETYKLIEKALL